jgi:hypothetical protein
MLPMDRELAADLTALRWSYDGEHVAVEKKSDVIKRIGRSPDKGDAVVYAFIDTPKEDLDDYYEKPLSRNRHTGY